MLLLKYKLHYIQWFTIGVFSKFTKNVNLSYDVVVIQRITSYHKNRIPIGVITLCRVHVTSFASSVSIMRFVLNAIKSRFKGSYDKQNLTLVVISYGIYETRRRLVS